MFIMEHGYQYGFSFNGQWSVEIFGGDTNNEDDGETIRSGTGIQVMDHVKQ